MRLRKTFEDLPAKHIDLLRLLNGVLQR
jgi:hypothetical protein